MYSSAIPNYNDLYGDNALEDYVCVVDVVVKECGDFNGKKQISYKANNLCAIVV